MFPELQNTYEGALKIEFNLKQKQKLFYIVIFSITFALLINLLIVITKGGGKDPVKP